MKTLKQAAADLIEFIETKNICDVGDDDGDGYIDWYRSVRFEGLLDEVKAAIANEAH